MRLLKNVNIDFLGKRKIAAAISGAAIVAGLVSLLVKGGPALAIDFTGGTLAQLQSSTPVDVGAVRERLLDYGFSRPSIQQFGSENEILVRVPVEETGGTLSRQLQDALAGMDFEFPPDAWNRWDPRLVESCGARHCSPSCSPCWVY